MSSSRNVVHSKSTTPAEPTRDISRSHSNETYRYYPAATFSASRTYNDWARLSCADVHTLHAPSPTWERQGIYFHLNHPIRYVRVVGVVVAHTMAFERLHVLTLDDGSGATLDVRVPHEPFPSALRDPNDEDNEHTYAGPSRAKRAVKTIIHPTSVPGIELRTSQDEPLPTLHVTTPISSKASSSTATSSKANTIAPTTATALIEGTILKAKGTLSTFRNTIQLDLRRASIIRSTSEEMQCWTEVIEYAKIIMTPWILAESEVKRLEKVALEGEAARRKRKRARVKARARARLKATAEVENNEKAEDVEEEEEQEEVEEEEGEHRERRGRKDTSSGE